MRRPRLVASAPLVALVLTAILAGPTSALEPPRPLPGYVPAFVSEREPGGHWEDCLWASGAMLLDKLTNGAVVVGRDRLRALSGDHEGGSSLKDLSRAFARLDLDVQISPDDGRITWKALLSRLAHGGGAVLLGDDHALPKRYGRWDPTFWGQTGAKDDHAVYVDRYDPRTGMVWLMDPLAWNGWTGEWIKATSLRRFAWKARGGVVAALTPAAQPAPFVGVKVGAATASAGPGAIEFTWPLTARRGWVYPGADVRATITPVGPDDAVDPASVTTMPIDPGTPAAAPAASIRPKTLVATVPLPRDPGVYRVGVTLTDRRFGAVVAAGTPTVVYVPGDRAATVSVHVSAARTSGGRAVATVRDSVRMTLVARNTGSRSWVDPTPGVRLPDDVAPLDTRIMARWVAMDSGVAGGGKLADGPTLDLGPAALDPGQALGRSAQLVLPSTAGRWALVVEVSDTVNGRFSAIGSAPGVVVFDVSAPPQDGPLR
jgi:hypothetical protein